MNWLWLALAITGLVGLAALAYWQLIVAEGAYLGPRVVAWTYDLVASRYDAIKRFEPGDERWFVAGPLLRGLVGIERPLVLDVATGTGRLPLALLRERFRGQIVGLDISPGMLRQARRKLRSYGDQVCLICEDASHLPFEDNTFDAVTCMESLEFMPRPLEVLSEMVRVLAPGGVLLLTNRVGVEARLLPRRAIPRPAFQRILDDYPLSQFEVRPWCTNTEQGATVGNIFYGDKGILVVDGYDSYKTYMGKDREPGKSGSDGSATGSEMDRGLGGTDGHFANFIEAVRKHDPSILNGPVETAHLSSALAHLGNIAYRLERVLTFHPDSEKFVNDPEADQMLTRNYRRGFEVPNIV